MSEKGGVPEGVLVGMAYIERLLDDLFEELDVEMADVEISAQEIRDEINAYRNDKTEAPRLPAPETGSSAAGNRDAIIYCVP